MSDELTTAPFRGFVPIKLKACSIKGVMSTIRIIINVNFFDANLKPEINERVKI
jgi:hypothetical protein